MKKTVGIIGAGNIAKAVSVHLLKAGYSVILSGRKDPSEVAKTIASLGSGAKAGTPGVAAQADIVILAIPWSQLSTLTGLTNWNNRIVIDATNHYVIFTPDLQVADLGGRASSEVVADYVPGARLVKAFNTLYYKLLEMNPQSENGKRVLFISGNHSDANKEISDLIDSMGFAPIILGNLATGGKLQQAKGPLSGVNLIKQS